MKHSKVLGIAITTILVGSLAGCYDYSQFDNISLDPVSPSFVIPVVNSSVTFKELAERNDANTMVVQKPGDDKFYLVFKDSLELANAADNFTIPPVYLTQNFQLDAGEIPPIAPPAGTTIGPFSDTLSNNYQVDPDCEIKEVNLSQGNFNVTITNNFENEIKGTLKIPSLITPQGTPYQIKIQSLSPGQSQSFNIADLNEHALYLFDGTNYNSFTVIVDSIYITSLGYPINSSDNVQIDVMADNLDFEYLKGKVDKSLYVGDHDFKIDIFRSTYIADQHIADPRIYLYFKNAFGLPLSFNINSFEASNNESDIVLLSNEGVPSNNTLLVGTPNSLEYLTSMSETEAYDTLILNKDNSNIEDVLDIAPKQFKLKSDITLGNNSDNHDFFITKSSALGLVSEIEVPLIGWIETNAIADTMEIDLPDLSDDLNLDDNSSLNITVKFKFINSIPLNVYFQAFFIDDAGQTLTTLYDAETQLIESAKIDANGYVTEPTTTTPDISISKSKYDLMQEATNMVLQFRFTTTGSDTQQNVVIESTNNISVQMSVKANGTVKVD